VRSALQGQASATLDAKARSRYMRDGLAGRQMQAVAHMTEKYQREVGTGV
jgi:limonene 1,2-monooxygenase